jgi:predicted DsbA family dithiol-disulfide isomerase
MPYDVGNRSAEHVTPRVLVFFDYACQFCYLDWPRLKRLRAEHGAELYLVPFELRPDLPAEGTPLGEVGGHSPRVQAHMRRMAEEGGLALGFPALVPNTHLALALGEYVRELGPEAHEAVHEAIFEAYNARGQDIGSREVLTAIAQGHALDADDLRRAWDEGRYDERIHQYYHLALALGITATPAALICNELLIGARPYRVLQESLERCLLTPESIEGADEAESVRAADAEQASEGAPPTIDT